MQNKKLFITDLDGTLLSSKGELKKDTRNLLNQLVRQGEYITFVTGRELASAKEIMSEFDQVIPFAAFNGSVIYDPKKDEIIYYWDIPAKAIEPIVDVLMESEKVNITFIVDNKISKQKLTADNIKNHPIISVSLCDKKKTVDRIYYQVKEDMKKYSVDVQKYSDPLDDTVSIIDITSSLGSKGSATQYLSYYMDIPLNDVTVFGDSKNDIAMFRVAGTTCSVGRDEPELLELAQHNLPYDEGISVIKYIESLIAGEKKLNLTMPQCGYQREDILRYVAPGSSSRAEGGSFMGYPQTTPYSIGIEAYSMYLPYNTNQIGVFSDENNLGSKTRIMEYEILNMLGSLYDLQHPDGYITSGGTEGNIVGIWIARNMLRAKGKKPVILKTEMSHSSISKAADLLCIPEIEVKIDENYAMDLTNIKEKLEEIANEDTGIILIATLGYTNTGTCDDIYAMSSLLETYERNYGLQSYIHIDAAIGGMVFPFIKNQDLQFFQKKNVMSISIDPHKMGYLPFSCGVFLGKTNLLSYIEVECSYSRKHREKTLTGSRNGAVAAACWSVLMNLGMEGYQSRLADLIDKKNYLVKTLEEENLVEVISNPPTNMCTLIFKNEANELPKTIEDRYSIHSFLLKVNNEMRNCYKIYIMPHLTYSVINEFINDIRMVDRREEYGK